MFKKILIANRGEIAVRIIRTCREMGIPTVAIFSTADRTSPHVLMSDEAVEIGAPPAAESYLRADAIIKAAKQAGCDAVHPGYGFLSENANFADQVAAEGMTWIGPPAKVIAQMGDKLAARAVAESSGVPVLSGMLNPVDDADSVLAREKYEEGFRHWRAILDKYPALVTDGDTGEEIVSGPVIRYRRVLEQMEEPFPEDFILKDLVDAHKNQVVMLTDGEL